MSDICLGCGKKHLSKTWGAECGCEAPNVVHERKCTGCSSVLGFIIDDDYCGPEKLYCSTCMAVGRAKEVVV